MRLVRLMSLIVLVAGLLALAAASPSAGTDLSANRRLLTEMRANDPEHYARLRDSFERFLVLPPERRDQLRQLDRQLHEKDSPTQARLTRALTEYAAWFTRLPGTDRQRIQSASSAEERLKAIRDIRNRQLLDSLPRVQREEYKAAPDNRKSELVAEWRQEQKQREQEWAIARRRWQESGGDRPLALVNQEEFRNFVSNKLLPMLAPDEKIRLFHAQEEWARGYPAPLPRVVVELSDKHPLLSLEKHARYSTFESLPDDYRKAIQKLPKEAAKRLRNSPSVGRWPAYAIEVTDTLRKYELAPSKQLGPSTAAEFSPAMEKFVDQFAAQLPTAERQRLKNAEGKWPDYPRALHELGGEHKVAVPELSLPGDPRRWDAIRNRRASGSLPEPR